VQEVRRLCQAALFLGRYLRLLVVLVNELGGSWKQSSFYPLPTNLQYSTVLFTGEGMRIIAYRWQFSTLSATAFQFPEWRAWSASSKLNSLNRTCLRTVQLARGIKEPRWSL